MGGRHHMGDSVGVAKVAETGIGVASSEGVASVDNRGRHGGLLLLSLPLAVGDTSVQAVAGEKRFPALVFSPQNHLFSQD